MNATLAAGLAATALGMAGYGVGLSVAYPGRSFSLTLLMLGVTLVAVGRAGGGEPP